MLLSKEKILLIHKHVILNTLLMEVNRRFLLKMLQIRFANADPYKPEFYYSLTINPFSDESKVPAEGGELSLKVKSFNADGSISSETKTYKLPFDKMTLDNR